MDVRRETVGGLPCWVGPQGTTHRAGIAFRVGHADETVGTRGITHLVEHLAIHGTGPRDHPYNGFVGPFRTGFHASGTPEEVWSYLQAVVTGLHALPLERLQSERRVLRAEQRPPDIAARLLLHRYGEAGPGLAAARERGLDWLEAGDLTAWAARRLTAGNAVLWCAGEPPEGITLDLPDGERHPEPAVESLVPAHPGFHAEGRGGAMLGLVAGRSPQLNAAAAVLGHRLMQAIRADAGLAYGPHASYARVGSRLSHLIAGSDCADHHAPAVLAALWDETRRLAADGPDVAELDRHRRDVHAAMDAGAAADGGTGRVTGMADDELGGLPPVDHATHLAELDALTPAAVAEALATALETAILVGPVGSHPPGEGFGPLRAVQPPVTEGRTFSRGRRGSRLEVVVGPEGLTTTAGDTDPATVPARWLEALMTGPEGSLTALSRDGMWSILYPADFDDGDALDAALRELAGADRIFPLADRRHVDDVARLAREHDLLADSKLRIALRWLPGVLRDDETVQVVAPASRRPDGVGQVFGLVAVSDRRVLWYGPEGQLAFELPDVQRVRSRILADLSLKLLRFDLPAEQDWRLQVPRWAEAPILDTVRAGMAADTG